MTTSRSMWTALAFLACATFVGNESSAKAKPEQQSDQVGVDFFQVEQPVSDLARTSEDVNPSPRQILQHESPIQAPEPLGREPREPVVGTPRPMPEHDVRFPAGQQLVEFQHELRRLLQIGRKHGEVFASTEPKTGNDR